MKIAFDAKRAFRNYSGLGNYSRTLINLLASGYPEDELLLFTTKTGIREVNFPPPSARIIEPDLCFHRKFSSYWRSYYIPEVLKNEKPDIYHGLSHELPVGIEKSGVPSVVTIHDLIFMRYPELYKPIDRMIYRKKWIHSVKTADRIIAISEQTRSDICRFLGVDDSKVEVIYQSFNPAFNNIISEQEREELRKTYNLPGNYILYVGTIEERKNLLSILKAIHEGRIDIPLVVVGKEKKKYGDAIHTYIGEKGLRNIIFLKNIPNRDLPGIYQCADLFVYPSSFEGFGLPVLEALQSGTPVIAAKGSCLEESGGPGSVYVEAGDHDEIAWNIKRILSDRGIQDEMRKKGLQYAKKFEPSVFADKTHKLYESFI